jgi:hypothetical protein
MHNDVCDSTRSPKLFSRSRFITMCVIPQGHPNFFSLSRIVTWKVTPLQHINANCPRIKRKRLDFAQHNLTPTGRLSKRLKISTTIDHKHVWLRKHLNKFSPRAHFTLTNISFKPYFAPSNRQKWICVSAREILLRPFACSSLWGSPSISRYKSSHNKAGHHILGITIASSTWDRLSWKLKIKGCLGYFKRNPWDGYPKFSKEYSLLDV